MFPERKTYGFVDESGDPNLNLENQSTSTHYIIAAVLVPEEKIHEARARVQEIIVSDFSSGEMKSSNIAGDDERRIRVLNKLSKIGLKSYIFIVDKREIDTETGLRFKKSFFKYLGGKVYGKLFSTYPNIDVFADEHGRSEFMKSVSHYVAERHIPELFDSTSRFQFQDSASEPLIQVADVIAGSIAKIFDARRKSSSPERIFASLKSLIVSFDEWPLAFHSFSNEIATVVDDKHDVMIRNYCRNVVELYLDRLGEEDDNDVLRDRVLRYLFDQVRYGDTDRYITSNELISHLKSVGYVDIEPHKIQASVIAHYRDNGVIIGSSKNGYKIPTKLSDVYDYVNHCGIVMKPMADRLKEARAQILLTSHGEVDILAHERFSFLRTILDSISEMKTALEGSSEVLR